MKKLFIGYFGKDDNYWFFSWAENEKEAIQIIEKEFGVPKYIKDISKNTSGLIAFKPINISKDQDPYFLFENHIKKFLFKNDEFIQKLIREQKNLGKNFNSKRENIRNIIEKENKKQKRLEEKEYDRIIKNIDELTI
jgi:hypothetical protein